MATAADYPSPGANALTRPRRLAPRMVGTAPAASLVVATSSLAAVLALSYHRLLLGDVVVSRDTNRLLFPLKAYVVARLRHGHLPLWYPYESLGTPCLAAGVTAVFHPLTWLAVVVGPVAGHALATLACVGLTGAGTFALARRLGASRPGAAAALVVAVGGGSFVSTLDNQTFLWGATAFPFFLVGVLGAVRRRDPLPGMLLAGGAVCWALLAGDFEAAYVFGLVGLATGVLLRRRVAWPRAVLRVGLAGAGALVLAAVQVLPSLAALRHIDRAHGLPWAVATRWSMHPLRLPELFLGDLVRYSSQGTGPDVRALVVGGARAPWQLTAFLGVLPLLGAGILLAGRRRRVAGTLLAVAGGLLWLALGRHGGLYHLAFLALPVWDAFRYPEKLLPFVQVLLAVVAGLGVTAAWRRPGPSVRVAVATAVALVLLGAGLALPAPGDPRLATWLTRASHGAVAAAAVAAVLALVWVAGRRPALARLRPVLVWVPALVALARLAPVDARLIASMSGPASTLTGPSAGATALARQGLQGPGRARITTFIGTPIGLTVRSDDPDVAGGFLGRARWGRAALAPDVSGAFGLESTGHYLPVVTGRYRREVSGRPRAWATRDAAIFNGRYRLLDRPSFEARPGAWGPVVLDRPDLGLVITEAPGVLPRAFVTTPRFAAGGAAARAALGDPAVAAGRVAILEGPPAAPLAGVAPRVTPMPARVVTYGPERVVIDATAAAPGPWS